ncbi:MAG: ATP-binding protein, partial [Ignavibacteriales bacterium]
NTNIRLIGLISFFMLLIGILYFRIISDIKKKQEAQRKLEESERLLWTIFNETSDALFITNTMTNRIERCNRRAIELFEVENQEELFGKVGPDFHKAPLGPDEINGINSTIMENKVWTGEIEYVTKKGRTFWGAVSITSFRLQDEVYKHVRIVDISVRKDAEKARKRYADELERSKQQLEKTTTELLSANEQLRLSENELKRLNASKDKFFSILAHDLRSPFAGFLGISEYLAYSLDLIDKNELNELLLVVHQTAKRIYGLLNNLLEWSRIQMGKVEFKPVEVPLYEIAQQVTELIKPNADQKDIKIFYEVGRDTRVFADINMVMTILRNLLSNAVKFTNPGGEVKLYAREAGAMIEISVRDSGIGINFEDMKKIFKIDSGYSSRGTEGEEGSGLGLILCRELVEKNRGTIQVNSIQGSGTEFMFTLQNAEYLKTEGNIIS